MDDVLGGGGWGEQGPHVKMDECGRPKEAIATAVDRDIDKLVAKRGRDLWRPALATCVASAALPTRDHTHGQGARPFGDLRWRPAR